MVNQLKGTEIVAEDILDGHLESDLPIPQLALGQWYWVTSTYRDKTYRWFGCVVRIGSNYIKFEQPDLKVHRHSYTDEMELHQWGLRVHFKDFYAMCEYEPNHESVLNDHVNKFARQGNALMTEIRDLTARLGLKTDNLVQNKDNTGTGLAVMSAAHDVNEYKNALVKAKKDELPVLFDKLKNAHAGVTQWMAAPALMMSVSMSDMEQSIKAIDSRIFNVSLYAGLEEHLVQCTDGDAAPIDAVLHVMQRKLYMDEECLLNYDAGGMEFKDIRAFDAWLSKPENRDRVLPFSRTLVAMQVRRKKKNRLDENLDAYINIRLEQQDKFTYLYIRNGEQLWRLSESNFEFDDTIFPDRAVFDPSEPMMFKRDSRGEVTFMTVSEYETGLKVYHETVALYNQWKEDNPDKDNWNNPYRHKKDNDALYSDADWVKFDDDSVYYDDACAAIAVRMEKYNRISLIIQGLFDRSAALSPHVPVKTWVPDSFNRSIKLVYDSENALYAGDKPDFDAYRDVCNASIDESSVLTGQELYWMKREADKKNNAERNRYSYGRIKSPYYLLYKPEGNDGMGYIAQPSKVTKDNVVFKWTRSRLRPSWNARGDIVSTCTVPKTEVFNISAYKRGDYKQFFNDPRTRQEYMKWAHLLLAAEDYLAGKHQNERGELHTRYREACDYSR